MKQSPYSEKLKDPRWQKLRLQIFERDNWCCQSCFDSESTLAVHHLFYEEGMEPWEYPTTLLVTLCESCHELQFQAVPYARKMLLRGFAHQGALAQDLERFGLALSRMHSGSIPSVTFDALAWLVTDPITTAEIVQRYLDSLPKPDDICQTED